MSLLKVNTIRHSSASSDAITLASDGTATAKITNVAPGNRNLIINGAMNIAQRGSSSTTSGFQTVDRFSHGVSGADEAITTSWHDLTSSDTGPWAKGFRKSWHIQNGNQTSGAGAGDKLNISYKIEAQDIAQSGWDYTSASSYITLSFWVRSSVAQDFKGYLYSYDGTPKSYPYSTGSLSANTWTKITKKIPGHADLTFDNNNDSGFFIGLHMFAGGDFTSGVTENAWMTYASGDRTADQTSTWWTTNDATFELTGVQLEVGDVATDYEHRRYSQELIDCQRYYFVAAKGDGSDNNGVPFCNGESHNGSQWLGFIKFPTEMRAIPTLKHNDGTNYYSCYGNGGSDSCDDVGQARSQPNGFVVALSGNLSLAQGTGSYARTSHDSALIAFDAEL